MKKFKILIPMLFLGTIGTIATGATLISTSCSTNHEDGKTDISKITNWVTDFGYFMGTPNQDQITQQFKLINSVGGPEIKDWSGFNFKFPDVLSDNGGKLDITVDSSTSKSYKGNVELDITGEKIQDKKDISAITWQSQDFENVIKPSTKIDPIDDLIIKDLEDSNTWGNGHSGRICLWDGFEFTITKTDQQLKYNKYSVVIDASGSQYYKGTQTIDFYIYRSYGLDGKDWENYSSGDLPAYTIDSTNKTITYSNDALKTIDYCTTWGGWNMMNIPLQVINLDDLGNPADPTNPNLYQVVLGKGALYQDANLAYVGFENVYGTQVLDKCGIGEKCFYGSSVMWAYINENSYIGNNAFAECKLLASVYLPEAIKFGEYVFKDSNLSLIHFIDKINDEHTITNMDGTKAANCLAGFGPQYNTGKVSFNDDQDPSTKEVILNRLQTVLGLSSNFSVK